MKNAKQLYLSIIVVSLVVITISIYYTLGGFEEQEVFVFDGGKRTVIGKHHIGKFPPRSVQEFLSETKALIDSGRLQGRVALVEFQNDTIGSDSTHLFVGAAFEEIRSILKIPAGLTYEEFHTDKIYRVFITQNSWVRPTPNAIRSLLEVKAIEDGEVLAPYTFDLYYSDGSLCTEAWTKPRK